MKKTLALATALCILANGCYFNSAAYLFTQAGYKASANSADIKYGQYVYSRGGEYFVELPRYRQGKEIPQQFNFLAKDKRSVKAQPTGEVSMFRIPEDFAMYLTGRAKSPTTPAYMTPVDNADAVKTGERKAATKRGEDSSHEFDYSSPSAPLWYTLGGLDWLCVDLPVSIAENAIAIPLVILYYPLSVIFSITKRDEDSGLSEVMYRGGFFWSEFLVKEAAHEKAAEIWDAYMEREPRYFTAAEADFMWKYVRALEVQGEKSPYHDTSALSLSKELTRILKDTPIR